MGALTRRDVFRWDPLKKLEAINEKIGRMMGHSLSHHEVRREAMTVVDWMSTVDIREDEKEFVIKVEVRDVDKKNVEVKAQDGVLTIQGLHQREGEEMNQRFHPIQRSRGPFLRSLTLPENAAEDGMRAEFKDGMLIVHLPKVETLNAKGPKVGIV